MADRDGAAQVVILAGGLGTRMLPRTERVPKILLPVAGRPFAAWLLDRLAAAGFEEGLLCVGHLGDEVWRALGDGRAFGLRLAYAEDGERLLGTAGALRRALPALAPTFLVTYGDSYLPFDYMAPLRDLRAHPEALGTMAVFRNDDRFDRSNTAVAGDRVLRYEKRPCDAPPDPSLDHIDYGATALRRDVVATLPEGEARDLSAVQRELAAAGSLRALAADRRFFEIGSAQGPGRPRSRAPHLRKKRPMPDDTHTLRTARLDLIATTLEHLRCELEAPQDLAALLGVVVPPSWPPGLYDRDAMQFFRARMAEGGPAVVGWYGWYAVLRAAEGRPATLVAGVGYFGPPAGGVVEIGYSTAPEWRGQGYCTECVQALTARALGVAGVERVVAEVHEDNPASVKVLARCGFHRVGPGREPGFHRYQHNPASAAPA